MPESATARIAAKLAARKEAEAAAPAPVEAQEPDDEATDEEPPKKLTMKEKQALRRQGKAPKVVNLEAEADDEPKPKVTKPTKVITSGSKVTGKKPPSPAQIAAREAFAAKSRARAAEAAKARGEAPVGEPPASTKKPVQTPEEVKASQATKRAAAKKQAEDEAAAKRPRVASSKPKTVQKPSKAAAARAQRAVDAGLTKSAKAKPAAKAASKARSTGPKGDTKAKVHALLDKGKTRKQIMEALGLSYPSVFFHSKSYQGDVSSVRGRVFVKTNLNEEGKKLGKGKSEEVSRSEAMRRDFRSGMKVGDVARKHGVRYQLAYTAIRPLLADDDE